MDRLSVHVEKKKRRDLSKRARTVILAAVAILLAAAALFLFRPTYISRGENVASALADSYFGKLVTVESYSFDKVWLSESRGGKAVWLDYTVKPKAFARKYWSGRGKTGADGSVSSSGAISYINIGNLYFTGVTIMQ